MFRSVIPAVVVTVLAASGCGGGQLPSAASRPSAEIVFTRQVGENGRPDLYRVAQDGSHLRLLVPNAANAAVSPDGARIAFVRNGSGGSVAIWVANRDGTHPRQLTGGSDAGHHGIRDSDPAWGPDGRTVHFSRYDDAAFTASLFAISPEGRNARPLTKAVDRSGGDTGDCHVGAQPSPRGGVVAYIDQGCRPIWAELAAVSTSGRPAKLPFRVPRFEAGEDVWSAAWSPDGGALALAVSVEATYQIHDGRFDGIYVSTSRDARPRLIGRGGGAPAWSPDGRLIAFEGRSGGIWLVQPDGRGLHHVVHTTAHDSLPAWLPPP